MIHPGSAQDYRVSRHRAYFAETQTGWIRMWADWLSLQPDARYRIDDPANPGYPNLMALDAQIRQARADGLWVMLMPYRHPAWANGTAGLVKDTDAEISFEYADRMSATAWSKYVERGRNAAVYNPSRGALEYRVPDEGYPLDGAWSRFFEFLMRRYHRSVRARSSSSTSRTCSCGRSGSVGSGDPFAASGALTMVTGSRAAGDAQACRRGSGTRRT